ncbi:MAG: YdcF family protein [Clostridia bacterium]|nr:YdcF family protein [Clostridia bacterium]
MKASLHARYRRYLAMVLLLLEAVGFLIYASRVSGELVLYLPWNTSDAQAFNSDAFDAEDILSEASSGITLEGSQITDDHLELHLHSGRDGAGETLKGTRSEVLLHLHPNDNRRALVQADDSDTLHLYVGRLGHMLDLRSGNFSGYQGVVLTALLLALSSSLLMLLAFFQHLKEDFFSYATIFDLGFAIFSMCFVFILTPSALQLFVHPADFQMLHLAGTLLHAGGRFMSYSSPIVILFALGLAISNLSLLRHEGIHLSNFLGILLGLLLIAGLISGILLDNLARDEQQYLTMASIYTSCFIYLESLLIATVVCAYHASRHEPAYTQDYVIILGCQIARDGSLYPLLRGRVDRALSFSRKQEDTTGHAPILVPSGGQGPNEVTSEAAAMKTYLISQGISPAGVLLEDHSRSTQENMRFCRSLIPASARVAFSTTNYHVFRSGVIAAQAGLYAEGMGAPTKWYFWPNALIREFLALMAGKRRRILLSLALVIVFFFALSRVLLLF